MDSEKFNGVYLMKENIENITKSDSNFGPTFLDHHLFPDTNFNGHCLIKQYFYPEKSNKFIYFCHTKSTIKKFKQIFTLGSCLFGSVKLTKMLI